MPRDPQTGKFVKATPTPAPRTEDEFKADFDLTEPLKFSLTPSGVEKLAAHTGQSKEQVKATAEAEGWEVQVVPGSVNDASTGERPTVVVDSITDTHTALMNTMGKRYAGTEAQFISTDEPALLTPEQQPLSFIPRSAYADGPRIHPEVRAKRNKAAKVARKSRRANRSK